MPTRVAVRISSTSLNSEITAATFAARVNIADVGADTLVTIDGNAAQTILLVGIGDTTTVTQADFGL